MRDPSEMLLEETAAIHGLLAGARRIAVLGIRSEAHANRPAHSIPRYLADAGFELIPVPVYEPEVREILGQRVYRRLTDVPPPIDLVIVFRRPEDIPPHIDDMLAARPGGVWFQSGIRNDAAALRLAEAGIPVVQDRCAAVEHRRMKASGRRP